MPLIVIDGPEKAGKTTLIKALLKEFEFMQRPAESYHWSHKNVVPDDRAHTPVMREHIADSNKTWIWDRAWPSEYVYGRLLDRDHRMRLDPWLGEWIHGRAVQTVGLRVILAGPPPWVLGKKRDMTDLDVTPAVEQALFVEYGERFGWLVIKTEDHTEDELSKAVRTIMLKFLGLPAFTAQPPAWCGPIEAETVFVGEDLSKTMIPGGWLPFSSRFTTMLGRELGDDAFKAAWTNIKTCDPELLRGRKTIITCGKMANDWFKRNRKESIGQRVIYMTHPSHLYRYSNAKAQELRVAVSNMLTALRPL